MKLFRLSLLLIISCLYCACDQNPTIEGRWVFGRQDSGNIAPAETYEFLDGQLSQGFAPKCFSNLQLVGEYSFDGNSLTLRSCVGVVMSLIAISDNEVIFDVTDCNGRSGRIVYNRP